MNLYTIQKMPCRENVIINLKTCKCISAYAHTCVHGIKF